MSIPRSNSRVSVSESANTLWGEVEKNSSTPLASRREFREKSSFPILVPCRSERKYVGKRGLKEGSGEEVGEVSGEVSEERIADVKTTL